MAKEAEIRMQIETLRSRISNPFNAPLKPIRMKPLRPAKGPMDVSITFRSVQTPRAFHCGPFSSAVRRVFNPFVSGFQTHTTPNSQNSQLSNSDKLGHSASSGLCSPLDLLSGLFFILNAQDQNVCIEGLILLILFFFIYFFAERSLYL